MSSISVIIPTLNGEKTLPDLLCGLHDQTCRPAEVIVVDSGSSDGTIEILSRFGISPLVIDREEFDHGRTRNLAARKASGDLLVFMTQDAIPADRHTLSLLVNPLKGDVGASYARQITETGADPVEEFSRFFNYPPYPVVKGRDELQSLGIKGVFFSNVCSGIRREVFLEAGMFPEDLPLNEDMLFAYNLIKRRYKVVYQPEAKVYHTHHYTIGTRFSRDFRIGFQMRRSGLTEVAAPESEGLRYLKEGVRYFLKRYQLSVAAKFVLEVSVRYAAYSLGNIFGLIRRPADEP